MIAPKRILILYWHPEPDETMRAAIRHHLHALEASKIPHELVYYNDNSPNQAPLLPDSLQFDAAIFHTTFLGMRWQPWFYPWKAKLNWIRNLPCLKIALPQDEYDHASILDEWLFDWGVSVILTNFDESKRPLLYPIMHDKATFYHCFTGYIDETAAQQYAARLAPLAARPNDIVYRATNLPYWFGSHGQLKHQIAEVIMQRAQMQGLRCDISTRAEATITGNNWLDFLASGKTVIGCESGSSVLDRRGEIQAQILAMMRSQPGLSFDQVKARLATGWDSYQFLAISPRHFEAIITKTCQILVEGNYDGVLEAGKHYLPLKPDFSNLDEVLQTIQDHDLIQEMAERAYEDIYLSGRYTYRSMAQMLEQAISDHNHQASQSMITAVESSTKTLTTLERELVAERHQHTATRAKLAEAQIQVADLRSQLAALEAERTRLQAEQTSLKNEIAVIRAEWASERAVNQNERQAERIILNAERKKWFLLVAGVIGAAVVMTAIISTIVILLLLTNFG